MILGPQLSPIIAGKVFFTTALSQLGDAFHFGEYLTRFPSFVPNFLSSFFVSFFVIRYHPMLGSEPWGNLPIES